MTYISHQKIDLLRQNARSMIRELGLLNDAYFEIGVTLAERHLLIEMASSQELFTAKDIANRLLLDKSTVSRLVTKAVKKNFISCNTDKKDRRKRFLQLTDHGKKILSTFEPIACNHTKTALQTLSREEIDVVYQGIALYAQGLKNARLQGASSLQPTQRVNSNDVNSIHAQLHHLGVVLEPYTPDDEAGLFAIFQEVVKTGCQFPYESSSLEEFRTQFLHPQSHVYVCRSAKDHANIIGGFYLKPNYSGRARHIANAAYMVKSTYRGLGIGTHLVKASLQIAKQLQFLAMQFNMVLSTNRHAIKLYEKLGFEITGTIPHAICTEDGSFQDAFIMYRKLDI